MQFFESVAYERVREVRGFGGDGVEVSEITNIAPRNANHMPLAKLTHNPHQSGFIVTRIDGAPDLVPIVLPTVNAGQPIGVRQPLEKLRVTFKSLKRKVAGAQNSCWQAGHGSVAQLKLCETTLS